MIRFLFAAFLLAVASCAPSPQFEGKKISTVEMRFEGERTVDESRLRSFMKSQPGTLYSATQLDDDIRTLYLSGFIDDMTFNAKPDGDAVGLIATVKTPRRMGPVRFKGNETFHLETLARESGLKKDTPINARTLEQARRRLEKFYRHQGYPDAKVSTGFFKNHEHPPAPPEMEDHYFLIKEGEKR